MTKTTIKLGIVGFFLGVFIAYMFCDIAHSYDSPPIHYIMTRGLSVPKPKLHKIDPIPPLPSSPSRGWRGLQEQQKKLDNFGRKLENQALQGAYLNKVSQAKSAFDEIFMGGVIGTIIGAVIGHFSGLLKNKQSDN